MKQQLNDMELDQVVGGTVKISESRSAIKFTELTGSKAYKLNCSFSDATVLAAQTYAEYAGKSALEYESALKSKMEDKGWI
jgi:hypothetical protein